jgi:hypothetical protein
MPCRQHRTTRRPVLAAAQDPARTCCYAFPVSALVVTGQVLLATIGMLAAASPGTRYRRTARAGTAAGRSAGARPHLGRAQDGSGRGTANSARGSTIVQR